MRVRLPPSMADPCEPLPRLVVADGQDLRPAILDNRVESERVHAECTAKHRAVVNAVAERTRKPHASRSTR